MQDTPEWLRRGRELSGKRVLITGGCGYVGEALAQRLLELNPPVALVRLVDVHLPDASGGLGDVLTSPRVELVRCDLTVDDIPCDEMDIVFHLASYGMSGREMIAPPEKIRAINLQGTKRVIDSCRKHSCRALVYLSTQNVVFGGQPVYNGDESMPYFPVDRHVDEYSRSKALAEKAVCSANDGVNLRTICIRPAAIYGEGERRHLPRIAAHIASGLFCIGFGPASVRTDWVYIDSLVDAMLSAAGSLFLPRHANEVAGECFFVSDGTPVNVWDFFAPLARTLGMPTTVVRVPRALVHAVAHLCEAVCSAVQPVIPLSPFLTRAEFYKVSVHHTFSINRARAKLGFVPRCNSTEGMRRVAAAYKSHPLRRRVADRRQVGGSLLVAALVGAWILLRIFVNVCLVVLTETL